MIQGSLGPLAEGACEAFEEGYARTCAEMVADLPYGRAVRLLTIVGTNQHLLDPLIIIAQHEPILRAALFDAVSGHRSYRAIVRELLHPAVAIKLAAKLGRGWIKILGQPASSSSPQPTPPRGQGLQDSKPRTPDSGSKTVKHS